MKIGKILHFARNDLNDQVGIATLERKQAYKGRGVSRFGRWAGGRSFRVVVVVADAVVMHVINVPN